MCSPWTGVPDAQRDTFTYRFVFTFCSNMAEPWNWNLLKKGKPQMLTKQEGLKMRLVAVAGLPPEWVLAVMLTR